MPESFRFALPIPGKEPWQTIEANWIFGRDQKLSSLQIDGRKLTLRWDGPLEELPRREVSTPRSPRPSSSRRRRAASACSIDNKTPYPVGETYFPIIGGIQGLGTTLRPAQGHRIRQADDRRSAATSDIFCTFANMSSFGDQGPEQFYAYPEAQPEPWVAFHSAKLGRSVYIGAHDPSDRKKVVRLELVPGSSGTTREDGNWPRPENSRACRSGSSSRSWTARRSPPASPTRPRPVFIKFHDGDWHESRKVYEAGK